MSDERFWPYKRERSGINGDEEGVESTEKEYHRKRLETEIPSGEYMRDGR